MRQKSRREVEKGKDENFHRSEHKQEENGIDFHITFNGKACMLASKPGGRTKLLIEIEPLIKVSALPPPLLSLFSLPSPSLRLQLASKVSNASRASLVMRIKLQMCHAI